MDEIEEVPELPPDDVAPPQVLQLPPDDMAQPQLPPDDVAPHPPPQLPDDTPLFTIEQLTAWTNNFVHVVGKGGQGIVYSGQINNLPNSVWNDRQIAVKMSPITRDNDPTLEAATIAQFNHDNIIKLIGVCRTATHYYIVMPFLANGNLLSNYRDLNWSQIVNVLRGAALALKQLHDMDPPVIFRDFKTENLLLDEGFNAVLCDFGAAGLSDRGGIYCTVGFTDPKFIIAVSGKPCQDIYSFGVVLLQLIIQCRGPVTRVHGKYPIRDWVELQQKRQKHAVAKKLLRRWLPRKPGCRKKDAMRITTLGLRCVNPDTAKRPDINGVIEELQKLRLETEETQTWLGSMACLGIK